MKDSNTKPSAIDLFSGCGGTTVGLKSAGFHVLCAVENAPDPQNVYAVNHPEVTLIRDDIRSVDCGDLRKRLNIGAGELDMLAGCPPCQGFSTMRTRNGKLSVNDGRNDLIHEFFRFTFEFRPKVVMLENVPGLKDSTHFQAFLKAMIEIGYCGDWRILNAKHFGVPQNRRRLIYIAAYNRSVTVSDTRATEVTVRDAISMLPRAGESGDFLHDIPERRTQRIRDMIALVPKDGGSRSDLPDSYVLPCHRRHTNGFKDVYGRMKWDKPSPTITGGCASPSKGRFLHPEENRCITLREAAVLQGFPLDYSFSENLPKDKLALMIGNALPAPFIEHHALELRQQALN